MKIIQNLSSDEDLVSRFLAVLSSGLVVAGRSLSARPGFFIMACSFIQDYLEPQYFKKEEVVLHALEESGFPADEGAVGSMRLEHQKSIEISKMLHEATKDWEGGHDEGRAGAIWATSEYTGLMRKHFDRLKGLIHPLLEQTLSSEDEEKVEESLNRITAQDNNSTSLETYSQIITMMQAEVVNWQ